MWQMLELIYQVFKKDGFDYFLDIMPSLHNYVTVDTPAFLSNPNHVIAIFDMCKSVRIYSRRAFMMNLITNFEHCRFWLAVMLEKILNVMLLN